MIIQMVSMGEHALFILDYKNSELTFRTSRVPEHRQTEKVTIDSDMVYTNLYKFHISYLNNFIRENGIRNL
jgi:hypothetical protein